MIDLYTWTTPNGFKPLVMLEELGLPYRVVPVNLTHDKQHEPAYLAINPNGKIPALVDDDANGERVQVFESGAILIYLAEKTGRFLPARGQARANVLEWLMFQMSAVGPMFGQLGHFRGAKGDHAYAIERFTKEVERIAGVLESRLATHEYLADEYSIADMATIAWAKALPRLGIEMERFPGLARWIERMSARPAVAKALGWKP